MRTCFFIATRKGTAGAALHDAPNLFKVQAVDEEGARHGKPRLIYTPKGDHKQAVEMLLHRVRPMDKDGNPIDVVVAGSKWTVWLLLPVSLDWKAGPRMMRKLLRARLGANVLGPYTLPELQRKRPSLAKLLCPSGGLPHVIVGDDPRALGKLDYAWSEPALQGSGVEGEAGSRFPRPFHR